jgi:hypothetical protein
MFIKPYEGPYMISKAVHNSTVEVCDRNGKIIGQFYLTELTLYLFVIYTTGIPQLKIIH